MSNYKNKEIRIAMIKADVTIKQLAKALEYHATSLADCFKAMNFQQTKNISSFMLLMKWLMVLAKNILPIG